MHRLAFSKTGTAKYISHLDLMRTFQRTFLRAGLSIRHTEGFNPHAFVSIPLPLSVGFSSSCEVLECELLGEVDLSAIPARMSAALPAGIEVFRCYEAVQPVKALCYVQYTVDLEYDRPVPDGAGEAIRTLLARDTLVVPKKSKKARSGWTEVDLIPLIARAEAVREREDHIALDLTLKAQNPGLNPELVIAALRRECPDLAPDFVRFHRRAVLDGQFRIWE